MKRTPVVRACAAPGIVEPGDDDIAVVCGLRAVHGDEVAIENAGIAHAEADDAQQEIRARPEHLRIDGEVRLDIAFGHDGAAGSDPPDEGKVSRRRQPRAVRQTQAAMFRRAFKRALADQCVDVILG